MISKTSHRCSKFFAVVRNERLHSTRWLLFFLLSLIFTFKYIIARNISHHRNGLFLILWYGRHKVGLQQTISLQVVWNITTKCYTPRVKKSSVKWKCEKEIVHLVHNYSVTGREPRKNVLLTYHNLLLLWAIFLFFQRSLPFSCYIFTSDLTSIGNDVLVFRT